MYEMHFEGKSFASDDMFGRPMEMQLQWTVRLAGMKQTHPRAGRRRQTHLLIKMETKLPGTI